MSSRLRRKSSATSTRGSSPDQSATSETPPPTTGEPLSKRARFDQKYETATKSDAEVLGANSILLL
jgi:hypothetical protein